MSELEQSIVQLLETYREFVVKVHQSNLEIDKALRALMAEQAKLEQKLAGRKS